jgi:hypothetical protein
LLLLTQIAAAQEPSPLPRYTPVAGEISTAGGQEVWTFEALANSVVSIKVETDDSSFDPTVQVLDPDGRPIITNDDFAYPDTRDALLEAITLPRTGVFQVVVSGYADTAGSYMLTLLPGYADPLTVDEFSSVSRWTSDNEDLEIISQDDAMLLQLAGVAQSAVAFAPESNIISDFYAAVDVSGILAINTWSVGMALRQQGDRQYRFMVNAEGQWRFTLVDTGVETVLRDWTVHPAILPGQTEFTLGVLAHGSGFDIFYNNQLMGQVNDTTLTEPGLVGLVVGTADALASETIGTFDRLAITVPVTVDGEPLLPDQIIIGTTTQTVQELERRRIIPAGGAQALAVPESFVESARPGVAIQTLGRGVTFARYALSTNATLATAAEGISACGLLFQATGETDYAVAYVDNSGVYGVSVRSGEDFAPGIFGEGLEVNLAAPVNIMVVVTDDMLYFFVNGRRMGTMPIEPIDGPVGNALINFDPVNANCTFTDTWVWRLDSTDS